MTQCYQIRASHWVLSGHPSKAGKHWWTSIPLTFRPTVSIKSEVNAYVSTYLDSCHIHGVGTFTDVKKIIIPKKIPKKKYRCSGIPIRKKYRYRYTEVLLIPVIPVIPNPKYRYSGIPDTGAHPYGAVAETATSGCGNYSLIGCKSVNQNNMTVNENWTNLLFNKNAKANKKVNVIEQNWCSSALKNVNLKTVHH